MVMLILLSVLPVFAAWLWLKRKVNINTPYFLTALGVGILSLALAATVQMLLPVIESGMTRGGRLIFLTRAALIEEGSRFVMLLLFLASLRLFNRASEETADMAVSAGMIAGLAFAAVETASFAASAGTSGWARLLRLSAVLLHATCGIRCSLAASDLLSKKKSFLLNFLRAAALHTVYNFITLHNGARYYILGLLLTLSSFFSSLRYMSRPTTGE
jgi:RsiW-degrading membrane proteinase PrsW (M82 family)